MGTNCPKLLRHQLWHSCPSNDRAVLALGNSSAPHWDNKSRRANTRLMLTVWQRRDLLWISRAMWLCMPNYRKKHTREPPDRKWNGTDPLLIVIMSSGWVNRLQPHSEIKGISAECCSQMSTWDADRCPLPRRATEETAEVESRGTVY